MRAWLQPATADPPVSAPPAIVNDDEASVAEEEHGPPESIEETIRAALHFRAALADALSCCVNELLVDVASDIVAREL